MSDTIRRLPRYGWFGLVAMAVSQTCTLLRIEPFHSWNTPIAWTGYILFADALVFKRRGASWLKDNPAEFVFLSAASVPLWSIFELYNKCCIRNWYYVGLPQVILLRYFGYAWSFATILPAMFETADLVSSLRDRRASVHRADPSNPRRLGAAAWATVTAGALMLAIPIVYPSTYLAAPIWLGFIFLLDPLNARAGDESILGDWHSGRAARLINLLIAGLICGLLWELWNYWAGAKWIYNVPILPEIKVFEMPILGFGGFPAFAVECFVMYVALRRWIWRGARRPISI